MSGRAEPSRESSPAAPERPAGAERPDRAAGGLAQRVLTLQRSAGNAAVGRVLARDVPYLVGAPLPPVTTSKYQYKPVPDSVAAAIRTYVLNARFQWGERVLAGTLSMPEAVDQVRRDLAAAQQVEVFQIADIIRDTLQTQAPPETRRKLTGAGALSELAATLANSFAKVPTKVRLESRAGAVQLSISGLELETSVGGAKIEATATPSSVGLKTDVSGVTFEAKLEKDVDSGRWSKWSLELQVPLVGEAVDAVPPSAEMRDAVVKAHEAVGRIAQHLAAGGRPDDDVVSKALDDIKPAIEGIQKATAKRPDKPSVTLGAKAEGQGSGLAAGAAVTITF